MRLSDFFEVSLDYLVGRSKTLEVERQLEKSYTTDTTVGDIMAYVVTLPEELHETLKDVLVSLHNIRFPRTGGRRGRDS